MQGVFSRFTVFLSRSVSKFHTLRGSFSKNDMGRIPSDLVVTGRASASRAPRCHDLGRGDPGAAAGGRGAFQAPDRATPLEHGEAAVTRPLQPSDHALKVLKQTREKLLAWNFWAALALPCGSGDLRLAFSCLRGSSVPFGVPPLLPYGLD